MNRRGDTQMGRVALQVDLANHRDIVRAEDGTIAPDKVRRARVPAIVDTGAAVLVLPKTVAAHLGVPADGKTKVRYADNRRATRALVSDVDVELCGRHGTFTAVVEPNRSDVLIGAIVLEALDLLVDCRTQTLQPRDPNEILTEIE
jgi:predicted aspartyl protease